MKIKVLNPSGSLTSDIVWENIPKLAVLTGINGSGKSQLLNYINQNISQKNIVEGIDYDQSQTNFIPTDWKPVLNNQNYIRRNIEDELQSYDAYFFDYVRGRKENSLMQDANLDKMLNNIAKKLGKTTWEEIPDDELLRFEKPIAMNNKLQDMDEFRKLFIEFERNNDKRALKALDSDDNLARTIRKEIRPWQIINNLFEEYKFKYRMKDPMLDPSLNAFYFVSIENEKSIPLDSLSSGEKMIVSLIMWAHNPNTGNRVKCMLLDEIDAYLHPSMCKMLMEIIKDTLVKRYKIQVIMVTHSPSTIAYTPEESIFVMSEKSPRVRKASKAEVIRILSDGLFVVSADDIEMIMSDNIENIQKPILCVEGITDKKILKRAWKILRDTEMPFFIQECFDGHFIRNMFLREEIFINNPDNIFIGMLDYDEPYKIFKENADKKYTKNEGPFGVVWKNTKYNRGYIFPLTIPEIRGIYAGEDMRDSYLSIELLFEDKIIESLCKKQKVAGGASINKFNDAKKNEFATSIVPLLVKNDFRFSVTRVKK